MWSMSIDMFRDELAANRHDGRYRDVEGHKEGSGARRRV